MQDGIVWVNPRVYPFTETKILTTYTKMHNKPHKEESKKLISEKLKEHWQNLTDEQKRQRRKKISAFYQHINDKEQEDKQKEWEKQHREYILKEYKKYFTSTNS